MVAGGGNQHTNRRTLLEPHALSPVGALGPCSVDALVEEVRSWSDLFDFRAMDHDSARRIGQAIAKLAESEHLPVTVAVFLGEQRVYHAAFAGTTALNDEWIRRKRNTALRHSMSSLEVLLAQSQSRSPSVWLDPQDFALAGGAIPLKVRGVIVGTVVLSGLAHSPSADDEIIVRAVREARRTGAIDI